MMGGAQGMMGGAQGMNGAQGAAGAGGTPSDGQNASAQGGAAGAQGKAREVALGDRSMHIDPVAGMTPDAVGTQPPAQQQQYDHALPGSASGGSGGNNRGVEKGSIMPPKL